MVPLQVISFFHRNFNGAVLREKQNAKMRLQIPQQAHQTLGDMFGFIEVRPSLVALSF